MLEIITDNGYAIIKKDGKLIAQKAFGTLRGEPSEVQYILYENGNSNILTWGTFADGITLDGEQLTFENILEKTKGLFKRGGVNPPTPTDKKWTAPEQWFQINKINDELKAVDGTLQAIILINNAQSSLTFLKFDCGSLSSKYVMSDGTVYDTDGNMSIEHTWDTSFDKKGEVGEYTRWMAVYDTGACVFSAPLNALWFYGMGDNGNQLIDFNFKNKALRSLEVSGSWDVINNYVFYSPLENFYWGDGITEFYLNLAQNVSMRYLRLPNTITHLLQPAQNLTSIQRVKLPDNLIKIADWFFDNWHSLQELVIPESFDDYPQLGYDLVSLRRLVISGLLTQLPTGNFSGMVSLQSIDVPQGYMSNYGWDLTTSENFSQSAIRGLAESFGMHANPITITFAPSVKSNIPMDVMATFNSKNITIA
jgi:hypothetical protein